MKPTLTALLLPVLLAPAAFAQNFVPEGDFEQGGATWTRTVFNDPAGTTGFGSAAVVGQGPSPAVFAAFRTVGNGVRNATYRGVPFQVLATSIPAGFSVMWEKQVTTPIPYPTVNRVELRLLDANLVVAQTFTLQSPNQTGLVERASLRSSSTVAPGTYTPEIFIRYSNLAGIPFDCWVDDVFVGESAIAFFGAGCAGTGGFVPKLHTTGTPAIGNANFAIELFEGQPNQVALCLLGLSNTAWAGGALPFALGGGCDLLVDPLFAIPLLETGTNPGDARATMPLGVPNRPALVGAQLFTQWLSLDSAAANPFGFAPSAGMSIRVQN